jgi:hypothetical protein
MVKPGSQWKTLSHPIDTKQSIGVRDAQNSVKLLALFNFVRMGEESLWQ